MAAFLGSLVPYRIAADCLSFAAASRSWIRRVSLLLPAQLDLGVLLRHADGAVDGDFRRHDTRPANFLPPRYVGAPEGVRTKTGEVAALCRCCSLQSLAHAGIPQREPAAVCPDENPVLELRVIRCSLRAVAVNQVSQRERPLAGLGLRIIDIATPIALHDVDNAVLQIRESSRGARSRVSRVVGFRGSTQFA